MIAIRYSPFRPKYPKSNSDPSRISASPESCKATANGAGQRKLLESMLSKTGISISVQGAVPSLAVTSVST
jgi:hypothetical protein